MLQLRTECIEPLRNFLRTAKNEIVTCIFGDHIQFEKLDEMYLLPKDVMRIVHEYFDDKMIINCSIDSSFGGKSLLFDISDNGTKIVYHYYLGHNMLIVHQKNFNQKDDSIVIIPTPDFISYFNLSRLYHHYYMQSDSTFEPLNGEESTLVVDNNKYTITLHCVTYVSVILNHEILQRRIIVMKQLIDIIKKLY